MTTTYRRSTGLAVLAAATAIGLAACGGGSSAPRVANLGRSNSGSATSTGGGNATATVPAGNATQLLDEWAACMRSHGAPDVSDPTVTANKVIDIINWNPATPGGIDGTNKGGQGNSGPGQYCRAYMTAAQTALRGGQPQRQPNPAQLEKFSRCMRANGVPDFPDPSSGGLSISMNAGGDLNPSSPTFHNASKLCAQQTGVPGFGGGAQPGMIVFNGAGPGGANG